jgi:diadenosine tetraphosphate (Ap4A) HIT family hydrolase
MHIFPRFVFAVKDKFQVSEGHTLIIPYRHVIDYFSMNSSEKKNAETLIEQIKIDLLSKDSSITEFNIGMNCNQLRALE